MVTSDVDCIMSIEQFKELCRRSLGKASSKDYRMVELQLLADGRISKHQSSDMVVVKFAGSRNQKVVAVTERDIWILRYEAY